MIKINTKKNLVLLTVLSTIIVLITIVGQSGAQNQDDAILDYSTAKKAFTNEKRKEKNKRFNSVGLAETIKLTEELPEGAENLPTITHWWIGLPALPVSETEASVIGIVINRAAYLSDDETNIYTEYKVKLENVLKDSTESLDSLDVVELVRNGGSIRFESGKIQKNKISEQGTVDNENRYLLFLRKDNGVDWFIVTGYKIVGEKVIPIDGQGNKNPKNTLPFNKYFNVTKNTLIEDVRKELEKDKTKGGTE